jgi:hypothetical protein
MENFYVISIPLIFRKATLRGLGIFLFTTASRQALGPTQPPIPPWGSSDRGVKLTAHSI